MHYLVGLLNVGLGCVYTSYGIMTGIDMRRGWSRYGFSHFGAAWLAMAFTCGPHHLEHGLHQIFAGRSGAGLEVLALLAGAPAGVVWFLLRIEALRGGRGDRPIRGTPAWVRALPYLGAVYVAALGAGILVVVRNGMTFDPRMTPSVLLLGLYTMVGYYLLRSQLNRHAAEGGWSTSGISLTAVFPTCALMHVSWLVYASVGTYDIDWHLLTIDWLSVPAAIYFVWVVRSLSLGGLSDWNQASEGVRLQAAVA